MVETIDQEARRLASQAHERAKMAMQSIDNHKIVSAERWGETKSMIKGLYARWWWMLTTIVVGMAAIIFLLLKYVLEMD